MGFFPWFCLMSVRYNIVTTINHRRYGLRHLRRARIAGFLRTVWSLVLGRWHPVVFCEYRFFEDPSGTRTFHKAPEWIRHCLSTPFSKDPLLGRRFALGLKAGPFCASAVAELEDWLSRWSSAGRAIDCATLMECAVTDWCEESGVTVYCDVKMMYYNQCKVRLSIINTVICILTEH
jgi:hypothetical protein